LLIEAELEFEGEFKHKETEAWERETEKAIEFLQANIFLHNNLTLVAGRFLTPFGIFIERLHPAWIKNLQPTPYTFGFIPHSANGLMLRGGAILGTNFNINYSAYYSLETGNEWISSEKMLGGRMGVFLPATGFELGLSFNRISETGSNNFGIDFTQQFRDILLDIRGEYFNSSQKGSAYWIEIAYRLMLVPILEPISERSQIVLRWEQFLASGSEEEHLTAEEEEEHHALPEVDTNRFTLGWNFFIFPDFKITLAYGLISSSGEKSSVLDIGFAWRF
jgi:hypothetical protein